MGKEPTHPYVDKMKRTTKLLAQDITQNASEVFYSTDDNQRTMQQRECRLIQIPSQETMRQGESVLTPHPANLQHQNGLSEANEPIQGLQDGTRESAQIRNGKNLMTEACEVLKEASMVTDQDMDIQVHLHYASRTDRRRYNLQLIDEITLYFQGMAMNHVV
ncbi:hypothetical protein GIB67_029286 [Kingdonia uniflora]|uniref:Uncharacterized protein n=1 Tax=Kingdonia uniflora TaxID=39325 RepID=A0A7J7N8G8_9MAGN|nr:hypothetical protein GIB67_029286 [Kingdonia uniflora]